MQITSNGVKTIEMSLTNQPIVSAQFAPLLLIKVLTIIVTCAIQVVKTVFRPRSALYATQATI